MHVQDVIDGDLCEQYPALAPDLQRKIADELDRTPGEILKKLEDIRNKIIWKGDADVLFFIYIHSILQYTGVRGWHCLSYDNQRRTSKHLGREKKGGSCEE